MAWSKYLWSFAAAVYRSWVALVSGVGSIVLAFLIAFWGNEWNFLKDNKTTFIGLTIACFIVTMFTVWYKERKALEAEQAKNTLPEIKAEIEEVYTENIVRKDGVHPNHNDTYFTLKVYLVNKSRPIAIRQFKLDVNLGDSVKPASDTPLDHLAFAYSRIGVSKETFHISQTETIQTPLTELSKDRIEHGDNREGWLRFVLPEISGKEIDEITGITLWVVDAESNIHKTTISKEQWRQTGRLINVEKQKFEQELERIESERKEQRKRIHATLGKIIEDGREMERNREANLPLYEHRRPNWRGDVYEYLQGLELQGLGGTYTTRFGASNRENDIALLEEIQREFTDELESHMSANQT
jgi:hypothetical protein